MSAKRRGALLAIMATALAVLAPARGRADEDTPPEPPELAARRAAQAEVNAKAPSGPRLVFAERRTPAAGALRACSTRVPLCVHAAAPIEPRDRAAALDALGALESAWGMLTGPLRLPPPDVDMGTLAYDVVLEHDVPGGWETRPTSRDVRSAFDRAYAESSLERRVLAGCALDALAFRALARASLYRAAPATTEGVARAHVAYLSALAVPCGAALAADEASAFQSRPDLAVVDARAGEHAAAAADPESSSTRSRDVVSRRFADGAALFWSRLDWAFGKNPGDIVRATWMLSPTKTKTGAERWQNEPDTFDVLQTSFRNALSTGSTLADALLDVAVARAFLGDADDGMHQPETRVLGEAARVRLDWDVPWPKQPKRLAPRAPVAPTGSSYVVVRTAGAKPGARLRLETDWEEHAFFRWAAVKIDASGRELARIVVPTRERAVEAQMSVVDLDGADRVLLVAVNTGDPAYPFDPDDEVWEPHGWLLTIAEE